MKLDGVCARIACALALLGAAAARAQAPETIATPAPAAHPVEPNVVEVRVEGNRAIASSKRGHSARASVSNKTFMSSWTCEAKAPWKDRLASSRRI